LPELLAGIVTTLVAVDERFIIKGGTVNATGGKFAAGIGGGYDGNGSDITISGGDWSAGIGGGLLDKGKDITVSGDAKLKV
jgi:hypothetical protein